MEKYYTLKFLLKSKGKDLLNTTVLKFTSIANGFTCDKYVYFINTDNCLKCASCIYTPSTTTVYVNELKHHIRNQGTINNELVGNKNSELSSDIKQSKKKISII